MIGNIYPLSYIICYQLLHILFLCMKCNKTVCIDYENPVYVRPGSYSIFEGLKINRAHSKIILNRISKIKNSANTYWIKIYTRRRFLYHCHYNKKWIIGAVSIDFMFKKRPIFLVSIKWVMSLWLNLLHCLVGRCLYNCSIGCYRYGMA